MKRTFDGADFEEESKKWKKGAQDEWKATRLGEKYHTAYGKRSHALLKNVTRLNENIHTAVAHNAHCRKAACQLTCEQGFMVRINKIILTINQFIQRITMRYSKDKSIYPYCILIYAKDKSETLFGGQY